MNGLRLLLDSLPFNRDKVKFNNLGSLGTLFNQQANHWASDESEAVRCPLCDEPNDRVHFPLCMQLEHQNLVDKIKAHAPHMVFLPVIYRRPKMRLLDGIWDLPEPFKLLGHGFEVLPDKPVFYTDGSCPFPRLPRGHIAAIAVVGDSLTCDSDRRNRAHLARHSKRIPTTLIPIQAGMVPGKQTVNRAEFTALLQVARSVPFAVIHSDSQWAIDRFAEVAADPCPFSHHHKANFDLLLQLCELGAWRNLRAYALVKIKSHLEDDDVPDNLALYHTLGNRLADTLAIKGTEPMRSPFHAAAHEVANWYATQLALLKDFRLFLISAHQRRVLQFGLQWRSRFSPCHLFLRRFFKPSSQELQY